MPTEVVTAFTDSVGDIKDNILQFVVIALPIALLVVGTFIAIKKGIAFFKTLAGKG